MIGLIQRVSFAQINIKNQVTAKIADGILVLLGLEKKDTLAVGKLLLDKILNYRIFPDTMGKMNLNLLDIHGDLLIVPQFTLVAETNKGTRPGFSRGMPANEGEMLFNEIALLAQHSYNKVAIGTFGENMQVTLCNDGPVTFIMQV